MDIHAKYELQDCPYCGGAGLLEEENGWCWYVTCMDCGSHTASFLWNIGKVVRGDIGE